MRELFFTLADHAFAGLQGSEALLLNFSGEATDFSMSFTVMRPTQCPPSSTTSSFSIRRW